MENLTLDFSLKLINSVQSWESNNQLELPLNIQEGDIIWDVILDIEMLRNRAVGSKNLSTQIVIRDEEWRTLHAKILGGSGKISF